MSKKKGCGCVTWILLGVIGVPICTMVYFSATMTPEKKEAYRQQAVVREQQAAKETSELAMEIKHLNTKWVDGKERYFFGYSNHSDVPFEGSIEVELVGVNGKRTGSGEATTTVAVVPGGGHWFYIDNPPRESAGYQVDAFKYVVKGLHGGVQHGSTTKTNPLSAAGRAEKAAVKEQAVKEQVSAKMAAKAQDPAFREKKAASKVKMAKLTINGKDNSVAKKRLQDVVDDYPETEAAKEAERLLKGL